MLLGSTIKCVICAFLYMGWDNSVKFGTAEESNSPSIVSDASKEGNLTISAESITFKSNEKEYPIPDEDTGSAIATRNWVKSSIKSLCSVLGITATLNSDGSWTFTK